MACSGCYTYICRRRARIRLVGLCPDPFLFVFTNTLTLSLRAAISSPVSTELWDLDKVILKPANSSPSPSLIFAFSQKCCWLGYDPELPQKQTNRLLGEICGHVFVLLFI